MEPTMTPMSADMETATIHAGGRALRVAMARTPRQWAEGLVGHHLDVDGLLMVMPRTTRARFHMHKVTEPVLLALYDADGQLVDITLMEPETGSYTSSAPFAWALELVGHWATPEGVLDVLADLHEGLQP